MSVDAMAAGTSSIQSLGRTVAMAVVLLLPVTAVAPAGLVMGVLATSALLPVTARALRSYGGAWFVVLLFAGALASGPLLVSLSVAGSWRTVDWSAAIKMTAQVGLPVLAFMVFLWARLLVPSLKLAALYATGLLLSVPVAPERLDNLWKYALAWPVTVLLLCATAHRRRLALVALSAAAGLSLLTASRSFFGFCVVAAAICLLVDRGIIRPRRERSLRALAVAAAAVACLLLVGSRLATHGFLGDAIETHTVAQQRAGVPTVLSVRPEAGAARALLVKRPVGFGPGVIPTPTDVARAKGGLAEVGASTTGEYVETYLFGGRIELHSVVFDMWATFGLFGLAAALAVGWHLVKGWAKQTGDIAALLTLLTIVALWNLAFSPLSSLMSIMLSLSLVIERRQTSRRPAEPRARQKGIVGQMSGASAAVRDSRTG